jgi:hypothetical protein
LVLSIPLPSTQRYYLCGIAHILPEQFYVQALGKPFGCCVSILLT